MLIPLTLHNQILEQLHHNNMGTEKTRLLTREAVYWVNMNTDIKNTMRQSVTCHKYQQTQSQETTIPYELPCKPGKVVSAYIFMIKNNMLL